MKSYELNAQIKRGEILPLYYFYGPEVWLIEDAIRRIKEKILNPASEEFNLTIFDASRATPEQILDNLLTFPINSPRRLTIIQAAEALGANLSEAFLDYLTDPNPFTCAIFIGQKADRRTKFLQTLEKKGAIIAFYPLFDQDLRQWIQQRVAEFGQSITAEALSLLVELVGPDLIKLEQEIFKLSLRKGKGLEIEEEDIIALSENMREESPFALAQAVADSDLPKSFYLLYKNLRQGEPPLLLLSLIGRQMRLVGKAKELLAEGLSRKEIELKLKILPAQAKDFWGQVEKNSLAKIIETWPILERTDREMKSSRLAKELLLEKCLWEIFKLEQLRH